MKPIKASPAFAAKWHLRAAAGDGEPPSMATDDHLAAINGMGKALRPLAAEDIWVRGMMAANNLPMRQQYEGLVFPAEELDALVRLAVGKPIHCIHDTGEPSAFGARPSGFFALPVGTIFAADRVNEDGVEWARFYFYSVRTPITRECIARIDGGNIGEVSINAFFSWLECSLCRADIRSCEHVPGQEYGGRTCLGVIHGVRDFVETSLVPEGAMQGTRLVLPLAAASEPEAEDAPLMLAARGSLSGMFAGYEPEPLTKLFGG